MIDVEGRGPYLGVDVLDDDDDDDVCSSKPCSDINELCHTRALCCVRS